MSPVHQHGTLLSATWQEKAVRSVFAKRRALPKPCQKYMCASWSSTLLALRRVWISVRASNHLRAIRRGQNSGQDKQRKRHPSTLYGSTTLNRVSKTVAWPRDRERRRITHQRTFSLDIEHGYGSMINYFKYQPPTLSNTISFLFELHGSEQFTAG